MIIILTTHACLPSACIFFSRIVFLQHQSAENRLTRIHFHAAALPRDSRVARVSRPRETNHETSTRHTAPQVYILNPRRRKRHFVRERVPVAATVCGDVESVFVSRPGRARRWLSTDGLSSDTAAAGAPHLRYWRRILSLRPSGVQIDVRYSPGYYRRHYYYYAYPSDIARRVQAAVRAPRSCCCLMPLARPLLYTR